MVFPVLKCLDHSSALTRVNILSGQSRFEDCPNIQSFNSKYLGAYLQLTCIRRYAIQIVVWMTLSMPGPSHYLVVTSAISGFELRLFPSLVMQGKSEEWSFYGQLIPCFTLSRSECFDNLQALDFCHSRVPVSLRISVILCPWWSKRKIV